MSDIGERLRSEVLALGGIAAASRAAGTATNTIYNWIEKGNVPADKLMALARAGADFMYILTGERSATALAADEQLLLEEFRKLDARGRHAAVGAVLGLAQPPPVQQQLFGYVAGNTVVGGNQTVQEPRPRGRRKT